MQNRSLWTCAALLAGALVAARAVSGCGNACDPGENCVPEEAVDAAPDAEVGDGGAIVGDETKAEARASTAD
jgi:hypothetical protein